MAKSSGSSDAQRTSVFIRGGGFANKGAEAMLLTAGAAVRERFPGSGVTASLRPGDQASAQEEGLRYVSPTRAGRLGSILNKVDTARTLLRCGAMWDVGGYQFSDRWGAAIPARHVGLARRFRGASKPVVYFPQAWGPFESEGIADAVRRLLDVVTVAFVRDAASLEWLDRICQGRHPNVREGHDIAWAFRGDGPEVGRGLIDAAFGGAHAERRTVCVTPNMRMFEKDEPGDAPYGAMMERVCRLILEREDTRVLLLGHEIRRGAGRPDDRAACRALHERLGESDRVAVFDRYATAREVKSIIGCASATVGSRYHGIVGALAQGVPTAVAGWSHKYDELMGEFGLKDLLFGTETDPEGVSAVVSAVVDDDGTMSERLHQTAGRLRAGAEDVLRIATDLLEG